MRSRRGLYDLKNSEEGQIIVPEYVVMFFIVLAGLIAMVVFVQRALQARVRDVRVYVIEQASSGCRQVDSMRTQAWNVDCEGTANLYNGMAQEYEPYYGQVNSIVDRASTDSTGTNGPLSTQTFNEATSVSTISVQLPPGSAN